MSENLVTVEWLAQNLEQPHLVILDGSWHMPDQNRDGFEEYLDAHIPGALFFDIDAVADDFTDLPHMVPPVLDFNEACIAAGITPESHIIAYDSLGLFTAPRIWWMFKMFGHDKVSVLEGGLPAWQKQGHAVAKGLHEPSPGHYDAIWDDQLVADIDQVKQAITLKNATILDARPKARFDGSVEEPRPGVRSGHMPGAYNLPFPTLLDTENGTLKSVEDLKAIFDGLSLPEGQPIITSCGSGVTACILSLALAELGQTSKVYDGSWSEWGSRLDTDVIKS